jgi:hypothetical protein
MFQLEILGAKILDMSVFEKVGIYEKGAGDNIALYRLVCRTIAGIVPPQTPVWVYGAGRVSVKASLSCMHISYNFKRMSYENLVRLREAVARGEDDYVLEVPRGAEIVAGMLISDVSPEAGPGQTGE